jgi:hypothetical protein
MMPNKGVHGSTPFAYLRSFVATCLIETFCLPVHRLVILNARRVRDAKPYLYASLLGVLILFLHPWLENKFRSRRRRGVGTRALPEGNI